MGKAPKTYGRKTTNVNANKKPVLPLTDEDSFEFVNRNRDDTFDAVAGTNRATLLPAEPPPAPDVNLSLESSVTPSFLKRKKIRSKRKKLKPKSKRKKVFNSFSTKEGSSVMDHQLKLASFTKSRQDATQFVRDIVDGNKSSWLRIISYEGNSRDVSKKKRFESPTLKTTKAFGMAPHLLLEALSVPHACSTPLKAHDRVPLGERSSPSGFEKTNSREKQDGTDALSALTPIARKSPTSRAGFVETFNASLVNSDARLKPNLAERNSNSDDRSETESRDIFESSPDNTSFEDAEKLNLTKEKLSNGIAAVSTDPMQRIGPKILPVRENIHADKAETTKEEEKSHVADLSFNLTDDERSVNESKNRLKLQEGSDGRPILSKLNRSADHEPPVPEEIFEDLKIEVEKRLTYENYFDSSRSLSSEGGDLYSPKREDVRRTLPPDALLGRSTRLRRKSAQNSAVVLLDPSWKGDADRSFVSLAGKAFERSLSILRQMRRADDVVGRRSERSEADLANNARKGRRFSLSVQSVMSLQNRKNYSCCSTGRRRSAIGIVDEAEEDEKSTRREIFERISEEADDLSSACDDPGIDISRLSVDGNSTVNVNVNVNGNGNNLRDVVLRKCDQTRLLSFDECYPPTKLGNCLKIGEGVYGEVFLYKNVNDPGKPIVMKVIPVEGDLIVNGEHQKTFREVLSEIVIAKELSDLRHGARNRTSGFIKLNAVKCVQGPYPDRLVDLWDLYDEAKGSENDRPEFGQDQLYIVLEFENGGKNLEHFSFVNAQQTFAVFNQIAYSLAVAEEAFQFEHRDLHVGNILISYTDDECVDFSLRGTRHSVCTAGVCANIIDFTLSRATLPLTGRTVYIDLAEDEDLFNANGDYQFDIYRLMRIHNRNSWHEYEPYTNILWLHYLLTKLIEWRNYEKPKTKCHANFMKKLKTMRDEILQYDSCTNFVMREQCNR